MHHGSDDVPIISLALPFLAGNRSPLSQMAQNPITGKVPFTWHFNVT